MKLIHQLKHFSKYEFTTQTYICKDFPLTIGRNNRLVPKPRWLEMIIEHALGCWTHPYIETELFKVF